MSLTNEILKRIKEEIAKDPEKVGYSGKTDAEILGLLNNSVQVPRTIYENKPSPINRILSGMTRTPNAITTVELSAALIAT